MNLDSIPLELSIKTLEQAMPSFFLSINERKQPVGIEATVDEGTGEHSVREDFFDPQFSLFTHNHVSLRLTISPILLSALIHQHLLMPFPPRSRQIVGTIPFHMKTILSDFRLLSGIESLPVPPPPLHQLTLTS